MTTTPAKNYSTWALRGDNDADWYVSYASRSIFELCDAAFILANVQPDYPHSLDPDSLAQISKWKEALKADAHELLAPSGNNVEEPLHHRLSHQKLRAWCSKIGALWPIPESPEIRIKAIEQQLEEERRLRIEVQHRAYPAMSLFSPQNNLTDYRVLGAYEPEEVYRHLDYLTADQALDWMSRISGHQVEWETLWAMVGFEMCDAFMDCRAVKGLTHAATGEHEHREVFGLGICQIMNAVKSDDSSLHRTKPTETRVNIAHRQVFDSVSGTTNTEKPQVKLNSLGFFIACCLASHRHKQITPKRKTKRLLCDPIAKRPALACNAMTGHNLRTLEYC